MVVHLRADRLPNPLAVPDPRPLLSWRQESGAQAACRVVVDGRWDSGWIETDEPSLTYAGEPVEPFGRAVWRVHLRDADGTEHVSEDAFWEAGPAEWPAAFIQGDRRGGPRSPAPSPRFSQALRLDKPVESARLYATALGTADVTVGGERLPGGEYLPGWTDYRDRLYYRAFDVTDMVADGVEIAAEVGDGWWCGHVEWRPREMYGERPAFSALLVVRHPDGSETRMTTDESWSVAYGPIMRADLIMGQIEDRRQEWTPGTISLTTPPVAPTAAPHEPVEATEIVPAVERMSHDDWSANRCVYDFGQNLVGRVRLNLKGKEGKTVRIRYAEILTENLKGDVYITNLRTAEATDWVTLKGDPEGEWFEPRHTFHGFRYLDLLGVDEFPEAEAVEAVVLHSDHTPAGGWESDEPLLNRLWLNTSWGWRGNTLDVPTDCPQRDERLGWTGDAQVFAETSLYLSDSAAFWRKYARDLVDAQLPDGAIPSVAPTAEIVGGDGGPAWADVVVVVPWTVARMTGDTTTLRESWDAMNRFMAYLEASSLDGVRVPPEYEKWRGFGDWLSIPTDTPRDLIGTAFWAYDAGLMADCAEWLGEDPAPWRALKERVAARFRRRFVTADGYVGTGTQTGYLLALHFELLPPETAAKATQALVDDIAGRGWKLSTGFVGSPYLGAVLTANGRLDAAYKLLHQKGWPSFLYAVTQGATTIWERWDGWTADKGFQSAGMNSFNHYAYGAVAAWMMSTVAGIAPEEPGFRVIRFAPRPGGELGRVSAHHDGPRGRIEASWSKEGKAISYRFLVPPNSRAIVDLPGQDPVEVGPGEHRF